MASGGALVHEAVIRSRTQIGEEPFFRGYMQTRLGDRWGRSWAVACTSVAFGLMHFDILHTPMAIGLGVGLGLIVEWTGSVWPAVLAHTVNNASFFVTARWLPESTTASRWAAAVFAFALGVIAARYFASAASKPATTV